ncbi:MAG: signal peptidase II [Chloroflexia bacterium]
MVRNTLERVPRWPWLVALLTFLADQVSKFFAVRYLGPEAPRHSVPVIGSFLRFTYLENPGVSFGQLRDWSPLITFLTLAVAIGLAVGYRRLVTPSRWGNLALGLVMGGALGNLTDRLRTAFQVGLRQAYVVDFIDVRYYAVFNLADAAITVGGILYGAYLLFFRSRPGEEKPWAQEASRPSED